MLILASNSVRRKEILTKYGFDYKIFVTEVDESVSKNLSAKETVEYLSALKAESAFKFNNDDIVIGADTVVEFNGKILGKPSSKENAEEMLKSLRGKEHFVYTGVTVISSEKKVTESVCSKVKFNLLTDEFIAEYIASGSPMDKAGAYGIQDNGVVESFIGSYYNIVGLPIERLSEILLSFGITPKNI